MANLHEGFMKTKKTIDPKAQREHVSVPVKSQVYRLVKKICILQDMRPGTQIERILSDWAEKEIRTKGFVIPNHIS